MSIMNVWTSPSRAIVAVDTATKAPDGRSYEGSKMLPIVHANCVLAARGSTEVLSIVLQQMQGADADFDVYEVSLPQMIVGAVAFVNDTAKRMGAKFHVDAQELTLTGWSRKRQAMICRFFFHNLKNGGFNSERKTVFAPGMDLPESSPQALAMAQLGSTPAGMFEIAGQQLAWAVAKGHSGEFGGRLMVAEITPFGMNITHAHLDLPI